MGFYYHIQETDTRQQQQIQLKSWQILHVRGVIMYGRIILFFNGYEIENNDEML